MDAHCVTFAEQDVSRMRDVADAELRVWKKALEFSIRREMALQFEIVVFARHFAKKLMQVLSLAKLYERVS
jgi:hypothetical protein